MEITALILISIGIGHHNESDQQRGFILAPLPSLFRQIGS